MKMMFELDQTLFVPNRATKKNNFWIRLAQNQEKRTKKGVRLRIHHWKYNKLHHQGSIKLLQPIFLIAKLKFYSFNKSLI